MRAPARDRWEEASAKGSGGSSSTSSLAAWFRTLRIPAKDADEYARALFSMGFDDVASIATDCGDKDLERAGLKPGHSRRVARALREIDGSSADADEGRVVYCRRCTVVCLGEDGLERALRFEAAGGAAGGLRITLLPPPTAADHMHRPLHPSEGLPGALELSRADSIESLALGAAAAGVAGDDIAGVSTSAVMGGGVPAGDPLGWDTAAVATWMRSLEVLGCSEYVSSALAAGIDGRSLLGITSEADAEELGIMSRPHKLLLLREVGALRRRRAQDLGLSATRDTGLSVTLTASGVHSEGEGLFGGQRGGGGGGGGGRRNSNGSGIGSLDIAASVDTDEELEGLEEGAGGEEGPNGPYRHLRVGMPQLMTNTLGSDVPSASSAATERGVPTEGLEGGEKEQGEGRQQSRHHHSSSLMLSLDHDALEASKGGNPVRRTASGEMERGQQAWATVAETEGAAAAAAAAAGAAGSSDARAGLQRGGSRSPAAMSAADSIDEELEGSPTQTPSPPSSRQSARGGSAGGGTVSALRGSSSRERGAPSSSRRQSWSGEDSPTDGLATMSSARVGSFGSNGFGTVAVARVRGGVGQRSRHKQQHVTDAPASLTPTARSQAAAAAAAASAAAAAAAGEREENLRFSANVDVGDGDGDAAGAGQAWLRPEERPQGRRGGVPASSSGGSGAAVKASGASSSWRASEAKRNPGGARGSESAPAAAKDERNGGGYHSSERSNYGGSASGVAAVNAHAIGGNARFARRARALSTPVAITGAEMALEVETTPKVNPLHSHSHLNVHMQHRDTGSAFAAAAAANAAAQRYPAGREPPREGPGVNVNMGVQNARPPGRRGDAGIDGQPQQPQLPPSSAGKSSSHSRTVQRIRSAPAQVFFDASTEAALGQGVDGDARPSASASIAASSAAATRSRTAQQQQQQQQQQHSGAAGNDGRNGASSSSMSKAGVLNAWAGGGDNFSSGMAELSIGSSRGGGGGGGGAALGRGSPSMSLGQQHGALALDVSLREELAGSQDERSYEFSDGGTLRMQGFTIRPNGMTGAPAPPPERASSSRGGRSANDGGAGAGGGRSSGRGGNGTRAAGEGGSAGSDRRDSESSRSSSEQETARSVSTAGIRESLSLGGGGGGNGGGGNGGSGEDRLGPTLDSGGGAASAAAASTAMMLAAPPDGDFTPSHSRTQRQAQQQQRSSSSRESPIDGGIATSFARAATPRRTREATVILEEIGRGAGGIVHKAVHVPSLRLVAVKTVPVHDDMQRHQVAAELRAMHSVNMVPLPLAPTVPAAPSSGGREGGNDFAGAGTAADGEQQLLMLREEGTGEADDPPSNSPPEALALAIAGEIRQPLAQEGGANGGEARRSRSRGSVGGGAGSGGGSRVPCKYIVGFHDAYTDPERGCVCMVMEYMGGGTLQRFVQERQPLSEPTLAVISRSVLKGLAELHASHRLHRDVKPSNVLVGHNGRVKLSDFGVAREMHATASLASTFTGTLTYMSPERISHDTYSYPSDIWSLGLVVATLARGAFPMATGGGGYWAVALAIQEGPPPLDADAFSPELCDFVAAMLRRDPETRATARELLKHPFLRKHGHARRAAELAAAVPLTPPQRLDAVAEAITAHRIAAALDDAAVLTAAAATSAGAMPLPTAAVVSAIRAGAPRRAELVYLASQLGVSSRAVWETISRAVARAEEDFSSGRLLATTPWGASRGLTLTPTPRARRRATSAETKGKHERRPPSGAQSSRDAAAAAAGAAEGDMQAEEAEAGSRPSSRRIGSAGEATPVASGGGGAEAGGGGGHWQRSRYGGDRRR